MIINCNSQYKAACLGHDDRTMSNCLSCFVIMLLLFIGYAPIVRGQGHADCRSTSDNACQPVYRVRGGVSTSENEYPWAVALIQAHSTRNTGFFCGGSIINKRWVVTAGHCVKEKHENDVIVYSGSYLLWQPLQKSRVAHIFVHDKYLKRDDPETGDVYYDNDIALLQLSEDLSLTTAAQKPIPVMSSLEEQLFAAPGMLATVMGWGHTKPEDPNSFAVKLRKLSMPIRSKEDCQGSYRSKEITDNMICVGINEGGKGNCLGDSGGPLVVPASHGWTDARFGGAPNGWYVGDFNGDGKDDIFRYCPPSHPCGNLSSGAQVFLSTGTKFENAGSWTSEEYGSAPSGWYIGDFNGDGKDDIFRYCPSDQPCGPVKSGAQVFLSTGSGFKNAGNWTSEDFGSAPDGWYVGDFNGDGKDDIFRYCPSGRPCGPVKSGAQVFLSTGSKFENAGSWTSEGFGSAPDGWYVGDFNGDGKDDIFRYCPPDHLCGNITSGAQVFLSTGTSFEEAGSWTDEKDYGNAPKGWYVGDFNGDGKDDLLRKITLKDHNSDDGDIQQSEVFPSNGSGFGNPKVWSEAEYGSAPNGWYVGNFNGDEKGMDDIFRYVPPRTGSEVFISTGDKFITPDMQFILSGIVSWAGGCGSPGKYDVYARVSRYETWITEHMQSVQ